jgi:type I restriction enzyme S subunit
MEAPLGQVANVDKENIAIAQRIIKVSGKSKYINNYYLKLWLSSKLFQNDLQSYATGSTVLGIKASKLNNLKLLLPPKKEQQVILDYIKIETTKIGFVAQIRLML